MPGTARTILVSLATSTKSKLVGDNDDLDKVVYLDLPSHYNLEAKNLLFKIMSYLTETATLEFGDPSGGVNNNPTYEYHLPHTKTIDLIGEEFVSTKARPVSSSGVTVENIGANGIPINAQGQLGNVVLVNSNGSHSNITNSSGGVPLHVQQILQQAQNQVLVQLHSR